MKYVGVCDCEGKVVVAVFEMLCSLIYQPAVMLGSFSTVSVCLNVLVYSVCVCV